MASRIVLTMLTGAEKGKEFVLEGAPAFLIGRAWDCPVHLPAEDRTASRHHCVLEIEGPVVRLRDLGSLNGTFVNGFKLGQRERNASTEDTLPLPLVDGDVVRAGNTVMQITLAEPEGNGSHPGATHLVCC